MNSGTDSCEPILVTVYLGSQTATSPLPETITYMVLRNE